MRKPHLSLGSWAFSFGPFASDPWPFERVAEFAAEAGYDGIEINGFPPHPHQDEYDTPEKCAALMGRLSELGLGVSGYAPAFGHVPPTFVEPDAYMDVFMRCLRFCDWCGIGALRVDSVSPPQALSATEYRERFDRLAKTWRLAAAAAEHLGVLLVWEFEPAFFLNKPSEVLALAEAVGHPNFKLLFDTSHAYMGAVIGARHVGEKEILAGGVAEYARMLAPHIGHLHLIDSDGTLHDDETSTHAAFGEGCVDFGEVLGTIRSVVAGLPWWCVDFCFNPKTPTAARDAVPVVRALIEEICA